MPVLIDKDSSMILLPSDYSQSSIDRCFKVIESFNVGDITAELLWDSERLIASLVNLEPSQNGRRQVIASVDLTHKKFDGNDDAVAVTRFWENTALPAQVQSVIVESGLQNYGLATYIYSTLIHKVGLTLISDHEHYKGGQALWKKVACCLDDVAVYIFDSESHEFIMDNSERLIYNGSNIDDDSIWSIHPNEDKIHIVLVAESKK